MKNFYIGHDTVQLVCSSCGCQLDQVSFPEYQKMHNRGFGKSVCMDCDTQADETPSLLLCTAQQYSIKIDGQVFITDSSKAIYKPVERFSSGLES